MPKSAGKDGWSVYPTFIVSDVGEVIEMAEALGGGVKTYVSSLEHFMHEWAYILICAINNTVPELRFLMAWASLDMLLILTIISLASGRRSETVSVLLPSW